MCVDMLQVVFKKQSVRYQSWRVTNNYKIILQLINFRTKYSFSIRNRKDIEYPLLTNERISLNGVWTKLFV